jgi:flavin-dependent dehydrogenase
MQQQFDIAIMGGGLSGLCLARQLMLKNPKFSIVVIERNPYPVPEAAYKVGESTVELGAHYLSVVLGLKQHLVESQLPKAGLRFFFTEGNNHHIEKRFEIGSNAFPPVSSFQLDRGRLENFLYDDNQRLGITIVDNCQVKACDFSTPHSIIAHRNQEKLSFKADWVIDASGRFGLVKRQRQLQRPNQHNVNACWFRIEEKIDIDDWFPSSWSYQDVPKGLRYYSTNHFMGEGYWVWVIPLSSGSTSLGIVADDQLHPYKDINQFALALDWLEKYEPQCATVVKQNQHKLQDFHALKKFSHGCQQVFSENKWCLTGESGVFLDPLYSPGTDFIAISNTLITQLICTERSGESIELLTKQYQQLYFQMYQSSLNIYLNQYPIMGNRDLMVQKIIWDYAIYWGFTALLFTQGKLCDYAFLLDIRTYLQQVDMISAKIQARFRQRSPISANPIEGRFLNTLKIPELNSWQAELLDNYDEIQLKKKIKDNFSKIKELARNLFA